MSGGLNHSDENLECPLCMEAFELDDLNFFPCSCEYQICRFCWHRLRTNENGLCPACRQPYSEDPVNFKPLTQEELLHIKQEKKQKDLMKKQKITENRKHLANVRVVQKNLVFVVGLSTRLADTETLKKQEYFGRFGKIHKVVINHTTAYAGSQGPSASAYVTYQKADDALKAISAVNNVHVDGRTLKASLGTTKYCSHFMKNQPCPKPDCMYLHELGEESASFTKDEMQQGKHQELERKLQEQYQLNVANQEKANGLCTSTVGSTNSLCEITPTPPPTNHIIKKTTKDLDPITDTLEDISENSKENWPALSLASKENKRSRSKGDRNNSARQTPTEENNKRNKEKKIQKQAHNDCTISTSGSQDSGNSSASATPPPTQTTESTDLPIDRLKSSPVPVNSSPPLEEFEESTSTTGTTPSSLSSCSEPSLQTHPSTSKLPDHTYSDKSGLYDDPTESINLKEMQEALISEHQLPTHQPFEESHNFNTSDNTEWNRESADKLVSDPMVWNNLLQTNTPQLDDEIGFSIYEERTKALNEEMQNEKRIELLKNRMQMQKQMSEQLQKPWHEIPQNRSYMDSFGTVKERVPPPGFNGMSHYNPSVNSIVNKVMPSFMTHQLNDSLLNGFGSKLNNAPPGINGGVMSHNLQTGLHNQQQSNLQNALANNMSHQMNNTSILNYDVPYGRLMQNNQPVNKTTDPLGFKDIIGDQMVNVLNSANTLNTLTAPGQPQHNNPISNFFNVAQQPHLLPYTSQPNMIHMNNAANLLQKSAWNQANDLTAIDPAIVSSGQLTDSRTDSPPPWLRNPESVSVDQSSWMPYGIMNAVHGSFNGVMNNSQRTSTWNPTSPPPGFNTLSSLHQKSRDHKIESMNNYQLRRRM